jgi:long-chain acyl-CoA synthetase
MEQRFSNLVEMWEKSCQKFAPHSLFGTKTPSGWQWITYGDFKKLVDDCRGGLAALGVGAGDRVAIVSNNRVEWAVLAYATYGRRAVFIPMYEVQPLGEWQFILRDAGAKIVVAPTRDIYDKLVAMKPELPTLERVIGIELPASHDDSYARLLERGAQAPAAAEQPDPREHAGYIYTSGTTGEPKGVILSHGNICSNISAVQSLFEFGPSDRSLSFLYWAHSFGQVAELHVLLSRGCALAINDDVQNLIANLAEVKPTVLLAVPRIFNRIYDGVNKQMADKPAPIRALFHSAIRTAVKRRSGRDTGVLEGIGLALADRMIFSKIREKFGGRLRFVISGSAALNKEVAEFIDALGIEVYEGYGLSETSPVVSVNYPGNRKIGSVGKAIEGVTVRIDKEATAEPENGEIIVSGPNVMQGYHNRPEENAKVLLPDRSFRTGDIGYMDADGYIYITGRIKEQYKLETGKYVAPAPLEEELKLSPYIANVLIHGANRPHNVALIVPDKDSLQKWARENGVELGDLNDNQRVRDLFGQELQKYSANFKSFERPKEFLLVSEDFTVENGMLTPSLKLKRRNVLDKYGAELEGLY